MKFTCDSCSAQYMISDDKVGATGVKVRCKKCGNVITVRRGSDADVAAIAPPTSAPPSGEGLDAELGSAFDSAFGDRPPAPARDLDATQAMDPQDAKRIADGPAPVATEWYVAIGEAQVGPLPIADVKRKWEQGDVGPDSLCWRPGMGDWSPLSTVAELAAVLSPIPRPAPRGAAPRVSTPAFGTPVAPAAPAPAAPSGAAPDATWKPAGASALAALASEELQTRAAPAGEPAKPASKPAGVKSLVEQMNLAEQGGIEPTGALPLSIKGVERTDEKPIRRKSSVARGQEEIRQKRGNAKLVVGIVVAVIAIVGAGAFGVITYLERKLPGTAIAIAPPQPAAPPEAPPAPPPPSVTPPPAPPPVAAAPPATPPPAAPPVAVAAAPAPEPEPVAPPKAAAKGTKVARATPPPPPARTAVAKREEPEPPPPPPPPPPKPKKGDGLLDGIDGGGDDALAEALGGGGGSGRSVYVPPKPGGSAALPDQPTDAQVTEGIVGKRDALGACGEKVPDVEGTVVMRWGITPEGGVRDVKCGAPCPSQPMAGCLGSVIKSIRFPRSVNGRSKVEFPFKF